MPHRGPAEPSPRSRCSPRSATSCGPSAEPCRRPRATCAAAGRAGSMSGCIAEPPILGRGVARRSPACVVERGGVAGRTVGDACGDVGHAPPSVPPSRDDDRAPSRRDGRRRPSSTAERRRRTRPTRRTSGRHERARWLGERGRSAAVDGNRVHRDRRLDPGVDPQPLRRPAVRRARAAGLGRRGRRRGRPADRVRAARCSTSGWTTDWDAAVIMLGNNYGGDPQAFGRRARAARSTSSARCPVVLLDGHPLPAEDRTRSTTSSARRPTQRDNVRLVDWAERTPRTRRRAAARRRRAAPQRRPAGWRWRR